MSDYIFTNQHKYTNFIKKKFIWIVPQKLNISWNWKKITSWNLISLGVRLKLGEKTLDLPITLYYLNGLCQCTIHEGHGTRLRLWCEHCTKNPLGSVLIWGCCPRWTNCVYTCCENVSNNDNTVMTTVVSGQTFSPKNDITIILSVHSPQNNTYVMSYARRATPVKFTDSGWRCKQTFELVAILLKGRENEGRGTRLVKPKAKHSKTTSYNN